MACLGVPESGSLYQGITDMVHLKLESFKPQEVSNTLWAAGKLRWRGSQRIASAIARAAKHRFSEFSTHDLANLAGGFANLRYRGDLSGFCGLLSRELFLHSNRFSGRDVANILWSLSKLK